jgi:hypothetical protein
MALNLIVAQKDNEYWIALDAVADTSTQPPAPPGTSKLKPDTTKEANEINKMARGWAYKIPNFKGTLLSSPIEALLTPVGSAAPP